MSGSCGGRTLFPQEQAFPGSRADPQVRIFAQIHEDGVEKTFVLAEAEICTATPGQRLTDKGIWMAGQIADDIFAYAGLFDAPDLADELEQQGMPGRKTCRSTAWMPP